MNANLANLIKAFTLLTEAEKKEFEHFVRKIETAGALEKRALNESLSNTINFSPAPGRCSLCGK